MLTLEDVKIARHLMGLSVAGGEGRRAADSALTAWFHTHAEALLDAAERVARQEASFGAGGYSGNGPMAATGTGGSGAELRAFTDPDGRVTIVGGGGQGSLPAELRQVVQPEPVPQTTDKAISEAACLRIVELSKDFQREFAARPIAIERGVRVSNPHAATLEIVEAWYLSRGVRCTVEMVGREMRFVRAALV